MAAGLERRTAVCESVGRMAGVDREARVRGMLVNARRDMMAVWCVEAEVYAMSMCM